MSRLYGSATAKAALDSAEAGCNVVDKAAIRRSLKILALLDSTFLDNSIDPEAVKRTNVGCKHNTLAHECVHWYKHRLYYKMQKYTMPRMARFCKCIVNQLSYASEDENIMESQAVGIAPRILMPKATFIEVASHYDIVYGRDNWQAIYGLADLFDVSKQSVMIRLEECNLL